MDGDHPTGPVPWLDEDEMDTWLVFVGTIMRVPPMLDRQLQRDSEINHFEYGILSRLSDAPGRARQMSYLATMANGSLSRLSHAVRRLEDRGWVRRSVSATDGRLTEATLTEAGWAKVREASVGHVRLVRALVLDPLTPEQALQLRTIGQAILTALEGLAGTGDATADQRAAPSGGR